MQVARNLVLGLAVSAVTMMTAVPVDAAELRITVTGLRAPVGNVHLAVFTEPDAFPKADGVVAEIITRADSDHIQASFSDIGSGPFAIAVFHDENENREFDTGFFGIPVEGYGFANDARVVFGPPSFEAASVVVNGEDAHITIRMTY
jgi:uncharacterized protein (DUF2141 family)